MRHGQLRLGWAVSFYDYNFGKEKFFLHVSEGWLSVIVILLTYRTSAFTGLSHGVRCRRKATRKVAENEKMVAID